MLYIEIIFGTWSKTVRHNYNFYLQILESRWPVDFHKIFYYNALSLCLTGSESYLELHTHSFLFLHGRIWRVVILRAQTQIPHARFRHVSFIDSNANRSGGKRKTGSSPLPPHRPPYGFPYREWTRLLAPPPCFFNPISPLAYKEPPLFYNSKQDFSFVSCSRSFGSSLDFGEE